MPADAEGEFERRYGLSLDDAVALLYRYALYLTANDRHEAQDLVQGLLAQLAGPSGAEPVRHGRAFLRKSLAMHHIDTFKAEARRMRAEDIAVLETLAAAAPPAEVDDPFWAWVTDVVGADDARRLWLYFAGGFTQAQIADRTGSRPATVGDRMRRALRMLRDELEGEDP